MVFQHYCQFICFKFIFPSIFGRSGGFDMNSSAPELSNKQRSYGRFLQTKTFFEAVIFRIKNKLGINGRRDSIKLVDRSDSR